MIEVMRYAMLSLAAQNIPYVYGGNNPIQGLDCSGLVSWVYRTVGIVGHREDLSAQGIYDKIAITGSDNTYKFGAAVFFGQSVIKINHVAIMWDQNTIFECAGGDSTTLTREDAAKRGGCIKWSPLKYRGDLVAVIRPAQLLAFP